MATEYRRPLPKMPEAVRPFWEGCKRRELLVQQCRDCDTYRFPPRPMCPKCNSMNSKWSKVSGKGEIFSFIVVPGFPYRGSPIGFWPSDDYPLNVAVIELSDVEGIRLVSNIVDCPLENIRIGMPVEVVFDDVTDEVTLPKFKPSM